MKKVVKITLVLILSILILNIKAEAAGGICYNKEQTSDGYCKTSEGIKINHKFFNKKPLTFSDPVKELRYGFYGNIEGKSYEMFCIDSNLPEPGETLYGFARPFDLSKDYDRAIAKIYSMYVNDTVWLMNSSGLTFEEASENYIQIANAAMRSITVKYGNDLVGKENIYQDVYKQLEGKPVKKQLIEGTEAYKLTQKYYCSALLSCKTCNYVKAEEKNFCSKLNGVSTAEVADFKIEVKSAKTETINTDNDEIFSRIIEMKISGLKDLIFDYASYAKTNPYFKVTNVECENKKLTCEIDSGIILNTDILPSVTGNEYTFKVKVSGKKTEFLTETSGKITVKYEYHHVLNSKNLAVLRHSLTEQLKQRMIVLMPKRIEVEDVKVSFPIPAMCQTEVVNGKQIYKYGGVEVDELAYLKAGCCNVKSASLKKKASHDYYFANCGADFDIHLETNCINDEIADNMSHSYIYQKSVDSVLENVLNLKKNFENNYYNKSDYEKELAKYNYQLDENYLYNNSENGKDALSTKNKYCQMYTGEKQDIFYPGTVEATSGRFFVFNNQPYIEGEIEAIFHTDIAKWEKDYKAAIEEEKDAYYALEAAKSDPEIDDVSSYEQRYKDAKKVRKNLETYKKQCEGKKDIATNWDYYLEPELIFNYQQDFLNTATNKTETITERVELEVSRKKEKYWPNVSDENPILVSSEGKKVESSISLGYTSERFYYDTTENYKAKFKQTLYYIPKVKYYSLLPTGKYVTSLNEYEDVNYLDVGYVFNVKLTTYQGEYTTWFTVNKLGHLMQSPKIKPKSTSNIQSLLDEYLEDNKDILDITDTKNKINGSEFVNKCYYKDEEILYRRECPTCEDDTSFKVQYYTRSIAVDNMFPNEVSGTSESKNKKAGTLLTVLANEDSSKRKTGANWSNDKGKSAQTLIESAANEIYGDTNGEKGYLEYSFTLTPTIMQKLKKENKETNYSDFNLKCNEFGKECKSSLLTELVKDSKEQKLILENTRSEGWKYYTDGVWVRGSIAKYLKNGYPEEDAGYLNWP